LKVATLVELREGLTQIRDQNGRFRKKNFAVAGLLVLAAVLCVRCTGSESIVENSTSSLQSNDEVFESAFKQHRGNFVAEGSGNVLRILSDDNDGSRHQRFIVGLSSGQSLLVAHNIDLAPRVESLRVGDPVEFKGEYEWNDKGGTLHWTHHDPAGRHEPGWIRHNGKTYQ
jgi:Protein of unknown function (DUF3465)